MEVSKKNTPTPTELIDWLNDEGVMELDWDFPEDGDLFILFGIASAAPPIRLNRERRGNSLLTSYLFD